MCSNVAMCNKFMNMPWIFQMVVPFILLIAVGLTIGSTVEAAICATVCGSVY